MRNERIILLFLNQIIYRGFSKHMFYQRDKKIHVMNLAWLRMEISLGPIWVGL